MTNPESRKTDQERKRRGPSRLGGGKRKNRDTRKGARRETAEQRQAERAALTDKQQIARLDVAGHRAAKERKRLGGSA